MDKTQGDSNSIANEHAEQAVKNQAMATINMPDNENSDSSTGESNSTASEHAEQAVKNQAMATINTPDNENSDSSTELQVNIGRSYSTMIDARNLAIGQTINAMVKSQITTVNAGETTINARNEVQVENQLFFGGVYHYHCDKTKPPPDKTRDESNSLNYQETKNKKKKKYAEHLGKGVYYYPTEKLKNGYKVYEGYKTYDEIEESIAVKIVDTSSIEMKREVKHLINARHENIVKFIDCGKCGKHDFDPSYIAMELCDKGTLADIVHDGCSYEYQKVMLLQIMHGVDYIHGLTNVSGETRIIHRDLKPQNILRSIDQRDMKIIDFSLGKCVDPEKTMVSKSKDIIGTDGWGSPEHYMKGATMSVKSDIFSAGLIFYFVLSNGKHAFGPDNNHWRCNIVDGTHMDLSGLQCPNPEIARDLITMMLKHEPSKRSTAEEVLKHPFFWDDKKKLEFLCDVHDHKNDKKIGKGIEKLEEVSAEIMSGNWSTKLILDEEGQRKYGIQHPNIDAGPVYQKARQKKGNKSLLYDHASVAHLLRFIRNEKAHYMQSNKQMKAIFINQEDIWQFFSIRFPHLFLQTFIIFSSISKINSGEIAPNKPLPENVTNTTKATERWQLHASIYDSQKIHENDEQTNDNLHKTEEKATGKAEVSKYAQREPEPRISQEKKLTAQTMGISSKKDNKKTWELPRFAIGPQGDTVKVHGCVIIFPPGAVKKTTEFQFSVTFTTKHCPGGYIIITPTLKCKPSMKFLEPVKIQLPTWFSTNSRDVVVTVIQKDDDKPEPETITNMKLNQISNNTVEFECFHFSDIWAMIERLLFGEVKINITCSLYYDANGNFQFLMCADNEKIIKKQENKLHKRGYKPGPLCLKPMKVKKGDEIKPTLKCLRPDGVIFRSTEKPFTCTELFAKLKYSHPLSFQMTHLPSSEQLLDLHCALTGTNPQHNQEGNFNLTWFKTSGDTREAEVPNLAQRELQPRVPQELNQEVNPEKLEDVFQDEVFRAFVLMPEFKKFARSKDGLNLSDCEVETICQDNRHSVDEQKMGLLRKWKEKMGRDATPKRIREIVENYRKKLNVEV